MKQIALSLFVIAASGAYVWDQAGKDPADDLLGSTLPADAADTPVALPARPGAAAIVPTTRKQPEQFRTRFPIGKETTAAISARPQAPAPRAAQRFFPAAAATSRQKTTAPVPAVIDAPAAPFAATLAAYAPVPQSRPTYHEPPVSVTPAGMKLAARGYADGLYTGPAADAYYGIIQI